MRPPLLCSLYKAQPLKMAERLVMKCPIWFILDGALTY
nr:MAG TPA: hypothetical protein [Caudoviricetes sp.]